MNLGIEFLEAADLYLWSLEAGDEQGMKAAVSLALAAMPASVTARQSSGSRNACLRGSRRGCRDLR